MSCYGSSVYGVGALGASFSTGGDGHLQLSTLGAVDSYLYSTEEPESLWKAAYKPITPFGMEEMVQPFSSPVQFGSSTNITINRVGDMIWTMYAVIQLPGIVGCTGSSSTVYPVPDNFCDPCNDGAEQICTCADVSLPEDDISGVEQCTGVAQPWACYVNAIGQFIIRSCQLKIGGSTIDTLYNDYLFVWEELSGKPGKRLTEMIGKRYTRAALVDDSRRTRILYVPLPFYFTTIPNEALSLASIQFHQVQVFIEWETLNRCIQVDATTTVPIVCLTGTQIQATDLQAMLAITYVYLSEPERAELVGATFKVLMTELQVYATTVHGCQVRCILNFNHPVIELIWVLRRRCQCIYNNHFNYSGFWGRDPVEAVTLNCNNTARFQSREGRYFRLVQPYQHHTDIPNGYIYCYSFAVDPELPTPTGSLNFSRIDSTELILQLQQDLANEDLDCIVMARNWNIIEFNKGVAGKRYG